MDPEIPSSLEAITPTWLDAAFVASGFEGARVSDVLPQPLGAGQGFLGRLARLQIRYHSAPEDAPRSLIAKLPTDDPGGLAMGQMMGVWERESRFYREVAPHIDLRVPRCFYNGAGGEADYALLLEDLAPLEVGDQLAGASPEEARRVIAEIGRFHASWWDDPRLDDFDWMPRVIGPLTSLIQPMFEGGWPIFLERYRDRVAPQTLRWVEAFVPGIPEWLAGYADDPCSISHGDFRLDNMLFGKDGEFALIDWQMSMCCPGRADVVYFLATNLTPEVRAACEDDLLRLYRDTLLENGVAEEQVSWDAMLAGYHEGLVFFTVTMASGLHQIDPANERGEALFDALVMRSFTAAAERDAGAWLSV